MLAAGLVPALSGSQAVEFLRRGSLSRNSRNPRREGVFVSIPKYLWNSGEKGGEMLAIFADFAMFNVQLVRLFEFRL